jgi:glutamate-1-semialdehyde 2,1-aminomutase
MPSRELEREIDHYKARTPESSKRQNEAARYLPGGSSRDTIYFAPYPIFIDHGQGHYLFDVDGNQYLDFMLNATSLIMGHAHPLVVQALQQQAARGTSFSGPAEAQIRLARILCEKIPSVDKIRFTSSGTEGTLNAIRVARAFTGRTKIAKFEGIFHGSHEHVLVSVNPSQDRLGPVEPTAIPEFPGQPLGVLADVVVLPYNDLEASERLIRKHKDELACVIMEAIASNLRYVPAKADFLMGIRELTTQLGILLIFDEVQSFRVAPGGAQELFGVIPEITTLGKLIGGGMPVGAFGGREDIMALYDPSKGARPVVGHVGTFNANPMTMVAGETTMKQLTTEVYQRLNRLGNLLRQMLRTLFEELEVPAQITGVASLFGIHFTAQEVTDYRSALRGDSEMKSNLFMGLLNEGVLLQTNCAGALNALTRESEVDALVEAIRRVVQRIRR